MFEIQKTYNTSYVAKLIGIHPNTVRLYEEWGFITAPICKENGYRVFTQLHICQFMLARSALQEEVLQNGLRKKVIRMDTLRNWEMNGLLKVKRKENGYRVYTDDDINRLKIIRTLKCANYSLSAILRMLNVLDEDCTVDMGNILNNPQKDEDIINACDKLIVSLTAAKTNAKYMEQLLVKMKNKFSNPPL